MQVTILVLLLFALFAVDTVNAVSAPDSVDMPMNIALLVCMGLFTFEICLGVICRYDHPLIAYMIIGCTNLFQNCVLKLLRPPFNVHFKFYFQTTFAPSPSYRS